MGLYTRQKLSSRRSSSIIINKVDITSPKRWGPFWRLTTLCWFEISPALTDCSLHLHRKWYSKVVLSTVAVAVLVVAFLLYVVFLLDTTSSSSSSSIFSSFFLYIFSVLRFPHLPYSFFIAFYLILTYVSFLIHSDLIMCFVYESTKSCLHFYVYVYDDYSYFPIIHVFVFYWWMDYVYCGALGN